MGHMTDATNQRDLGILIGKVDAINQRLDRADESRSRTYARIDTMSDDIAGLKKDVSEMKPEVALERGLRFKAAGAVLVLGSVGALIGALLTAFWSRIVEAIWPSCGL